MRQQNVVQEKNGATHDMGKRIIGVNTGQCESGLVTGEYVIRKLEKLP